MNYSSEEEFYKNNDEFYSSYGYKSYIKSEQVMKQSDQSHEDDNNVEIKSQTKLNNYESAYFVNIKLILECRRCSKEFFSNNKLHKHLKFCKREKSSQSNLVAVYVITLIFTVHSTNKIENYHEFAFRAHRYATAKETLVLWGSEHDLCLNSDTSISLIDRAFIRE